MGKMPMLRFYSVSSSWPAGAFAPAEASASASSSPATSRHGEVCLAESAFHKRCQYVLDRAAMVRADLQARRPHRHGQRARDRSADHHVHAPVGQLSGALHRAGGRELNLLPSNRAVRIGLDQEEPLSGVQNRRNPALPVGYGDFHQKSSSTAVPRRGCFSIVMRKLKISSGLIWFNRNPLLHYAKNIAI